MVDAKSLQARHRPAGQGVCSEDRQRSETAGLSAAETPNQVQASHCSACVRVLSAPEASNNTRAEAKVQQMKEGCSSPWAADKQTDRATGRQSAPCWWPPWAGKGRRRQEKAEPQRARTQLDMADPAGWAGGPGQRDWLVTLALLLPVLWAPHLPAAACTKAVSKQLCNHNGFCFSGDTLA
jgi:hypothetical protein